MHMSIAVNFPATLNWACKEHAIASNVDQHRILSECRDSVVAVLQNAGEENSSNPFSVQPVLSTLFKFVIIS